uniref:Pentatricopeptide repeat-containing protein-mitochondrial domain-containing protein n=1 Tax=Neobodo designis TaxID=312471 RepID=A0A7S1R171_NEODS|mmetsp:Transcript_5939/g.18756  ORF Transcript_5939/g.18756 Transcript_5939/m.18756 type:complete len:590 (+) Transcript_5939:37-1806(+)
MLRRVGCRFAAAQASKGSVGAAGLSASLQALLPSPQTLAADPSLAKQVDAPKIISSLDLALHTSKGGDGAPRLQDVLGPKGSPLSASETRDAVIVLLRCCGATRNVDAARRLFLRALRDLHPDDVGASIFDTFLSLLAQQGAVSRAEVTFVLNLMIKQFKVPRTAHTFQALFETHLRLYEDCAALWKTMRKDGVTPSPAVLRLLIHGAVLPGHDDIHFVLDVVGEFVKRCEHSDAAVLEKVFACVVDHRDAAAEHALWLLFELEMRCVLDRKPLTKCVDRANVIRLLLKCAKGGDATTASRTLALMERQQIPATADALALVAWSYARALEVEKAVDALEDMAQRGMLDGVDHTKRFVIEALNQPVQKHYLTTVAECLSSAEAVDRAYFHLEKRKADGKAVSVHTLDVIVLACAKLGDEDRAVETMESYATLGVHPRAQSYNALLVLCGGRNKARQHRTIFEAMLRNGVKPNYHTLRLLIRQAVLTDNIDEALEFLERAPTFPGVRVDVEMLLPVLERAARVGDVATVLEVAHFSLKCDIGIDGTVLRTAISRLKENGVDAAEVEAIIPAHERMRGQYGVGRRGKPQATG